MVWSNIVGPLLSCGSIPVENEREEPAIVTAMSPDELLQLPAVVDLPTAADVLGVGHSSAYELVRTGQWPTPVLRLGRLIRVPTAPLLALVGVERPMRQAS